MAPAITRNHHDKGQTDKENDDREEPHETDEGYDISHGVDRLPHDDLRRRAQ